MVSLGAQATQFLKRMALGLIMGGCFLFLIFLLGRDHLEWAVVRRILLLLLSFSVTGALVVWPIGNYAFRKYPIAGINLITFLRGFFFLVVICVFVTLLGSLVGRWVVPDINLLHGPEFFKVFLSMLFMALPLYLIQCFKQLWQEALARIREKEILQQRLARELEVARNIQRRALPERLPGLEGWDFAGANLPYEAVGGDIYDLWAVQDEVGSPRLHLVVGDVSGKGLPAALMMMQLSAFLRATGDGPVMDWGALVRRLNSRMNEIRERNRYATLFVGSLDPASGELRYVNAGHNPPLHVNALGSISRLEPTGPMVGLLPGAEFQECRTTLELGDTLILFSDGIVEAEDVHGNDFGEQLLIETVQESPRINADEILERILARTFLHIDDAGFRDDVTLVILQRNL